MQILTEESAYEIFLKYLKEVLIASGKIGVVEIKKMFLFALKDYFEGKINLHYLETISCQLYFEWGKPSKINSVDKELGSALSSAVDINYYFQNSEKEEKTRRMYEFFIKSLQQYYNHCTKT